MNLYISPISFIFFINAIFLAAFGIYILRRRKTRGSLYFSLLMFSTSFWSITAMLENSAYGISNKIFWSQLSYIGIVSVGVLWLLFALDYGQYRKRIIKTVNYFIWIIPAIVLILAFTNSYHNLIWPDIVSVSTEPWGRVVYSHGAAVYLNAVYQYILLLIGSVIIIGHLIKIKAQRGQAAALIGAVVAPLVANALYIFNIYNFEGLDPTPLGFTVSGLLLIIAVFKYRLLDVIPAAKETVYKEIENGIIIVDKNNKVADFNPAAKGIFGQVISVGDNASDMQLSTSQTLAEILAKKSKSAEIYHAISKKWFKVKVDDFVDNMHEVSGHIVLLQDISREKKSQIKLLESRYFLDNMVGFLPDPTCVVDENKKIIIWNKSMEELTGVKAKKMLGKANYEYSLPFYGERIPSLIDIAMGDSPTMNLMKKYKNFKKEADIVSAETYNTYLKKEGVYLWLVAKPIRDTKGRQIGAIEIIRDITKQKMADKRLNEKIFELSKLNRLMTGREMKMMELKAEIGKLKQNKK